MSISYTTREVVKRAVEITDPAHADAQIDRIIEEQSRAIDKLCHRVFYPWKGTRYFDWPDRRSPTPWRLWLDENELIELTAAVVAGETLSLADVLLEPTNDGPPYDRVELDRSTTTSFISGDTPQRNIALTGLFGYRNDEVLSTTAAEAFDSSETELSVAHGGRIGTGSLLRIDTERLRVTERGFSTLGVTAGALTDRASAATVTLSGVPAAGAVQIGETLLIDGEQLLVTSVAGNVVAVRRAWNGSVLAAHDAATTVYADRSLTVERGVLGTTAAAHADAAPVYRWLPPSPVSGLCVAETINQIAQERSGYVRVIGAGDAARNASGAGLASKRKQVADGYARRGRTGAI